jgi:hypothetical protein
LSGSVTASVKPLPPPSNEPLIQIETRR